MAGLWDFVKGLVVDDIELGTEEGVAIEIERIQSHEQAIYEAECRRLREEQERKRAEIEARVKREVEEKAEEKAEEERLRKEEEERKEREEAEAERMRIQRQKEEEFRGKVMNIKAAEENAKRDAFYAKLAAEAQEKMRLQEAARETEREGREREYVEALKTKARARQEAELNAFRNDKSKSYDFWITPKKRPLTEPPSLDWDCFFRTQIPSDIRFLALFPDSPEKRARMKDLEGEAKILLEYRITMTLEKEDVEHGEERRSFYHLVEQSLIHEWGEVNEERKKLWMQGIELGRFEFEFLDDKGKPTKIEEALKRGADVFRGYGKEVREKHEYLIPEGWVEFKEATFRFHEYNEEFLRPTAGEKLMQGIDVLSQYQSEEVEKEHGHLRPVFLPAPASMRSNEPPSSEKRGQEERERVLRVLPPPPPGPRPANLDKWGFAIK